jgi:hypothetical protein
MNSTLAGGTCRATQVRLVEGLDCPVEHRVVGDLVGELRAQIALAMSRRLALGPVPGVRWRSREF